MRPEQKEELAVSETLTISLGQQEDDREYGISVLPSWTFLCPHISNGARSMVSLLAFLDQSVPPGAQRPTLRQIGDIFPAGPVGIGEEPERLGPEGARSRLQELADVGQVASLDGGSAWVPDSVEDEVRIRLCRDLHHQCGAASLLG